MFGTYHTVFKFRVAMAPFLFLFLRPKSMGVIVKHNNDQQLLGEVDCRFWLSGESERENYGCIYFLLDWIWEYGGSARHHDGPCKKILQLDWNGHCRPKLML